MLNNLPLEHLAIRRKHARLCMLFKMSKGLTPMLCPDEFRLKALQRRTDNGYSFEHFVSHSDPLFSSFFPRTVRDWNSLPENLVSLHSLEHFSSALGKQ